MTESNSLDLAIDAGIATLTLNRPDAHNALDVDMLERMPYMLRKLSDDDQVRCVVVTGEGDRAFCAGGDISSLGDAEVPDPSQLVDRLESWSQASVLLHEMPKPTIAVVNGIAAGAGMALALACDLRVASDTARFHSSFVKLAMSGDFGGSYFLTRLVGPSKARELYFLGEATSADDALALGMVNWVVPSASVRGFGRTIAEKLAAVPAITIRNMKRNLSASETEPLARVVRLEAEAMIETAMSEETRAAAKKFFQAR